MRRITKIETRDGKLHSGQKEAQKHIDKIYGDILLKLARDLTNHMKYMETAEYLDANLDKFVELKAWKDDKKMEADDEME